MQLAFTLVLVAVIPSASAVLPAAAQGLTAERLHQLCHDRASSDWERIGQWLRPAYIRGIVDGARLQAFHVTGLMATNQRVMQFCEPPRTTADAAIDVVVRYIETRPESRPLAVAAVVYEALSAEWPCPK